MSNILLVLSSPRGEESNSTKVARSLVANLEAKSHGSNTVVRDVATHKLPHIDNDFISATRGQPVSLSVAQTEAVKLSDTLLAEVNAADVIVIGASMLNFGVPSTLKSWVDYLAVPGKTFSYSENGPKGHLTGKKVYLVQATAGVYSQGPGQAADFLSPYLRQVLGFMGLTDFEVIHVEGTAFGPEAAEKAMNQAFDRAAALAA